jgi:hypothetical protein
MGEAQGLVVPGCSHKVAHWMAGKRPQLPILTVMLQAQLSLSVPSRQER